MEIVEDLKSPKEFKVPDGICPTVVRTKPKDSSTLSDVINSRPSEDVARMSSPSSTTPKAGDFPGPTAEQVSKYASMLSQLKYKEPSTAESFDPNYGLEVLKNGSIVDTIKFKPEKSFCVIGRVPGCDILGEHPTISRIHAILQFVGGTGSEDDVDKDTSGDGNCSRKGLYVFDLNSTHGTFLNKNQLIPNRYYRLHVGHVLKFGNSTRLYVVLGPDDDQEEESEKSVTELVKEKNDDELRRKKLLDKIGTSSVDRATGDSGEDNEGIGWGMAEDATEESGLSVNPFALDFHESNELSLDNPKRTLHTWFEREGYDLVYDVKEKSNGHFMCTVSLPIDGPSGAPVIAEADGKGKKKEIMAQCALKACQILDKYGVLRKSNQEGFKRKKTDWEAKDYYSSDEDTFLDRTGSVELKRKMRMKHAGKLDEKVETYESLVEQYKNFEAELDELEGKVEKAESKKKCTTETTTSDPLDAFMLDLKTGITDIGKMKTKIKELEDKKSHVLKLINMVKPAGSTFQPSRNPTSAKRLHFPIPDQSERRTKVLFGPRRGFSASSAKSLIVTKPVQPHALQPPVVIDIDVEETQKLLEELPQRPTTSTVDSEKVKEEASPAVLKSEVVKVAEVSNSDEEVDEIPKPKRKRHRQPKKPVIYEYDANNPDYSIWVPPPDQVGDGRTKLNEKLGY